MKAEKVCVVTGAGGYLGSKVSEQLSKNGWKVWKASSSLKHSESISFSLREGIHPEDLRSKQVQLLIHCAYDFSARTPAEISEANIQGSIRLLKGAHQAGVTQLIFISSMASFEGCRSLYGQAKLAVEKEALTLGAVVVRPGLILGKNTGGIVGAILGVMKKFRWIPLIGSGKQIQYLTYDEDLARFIQKLADHPDQAPPSPISAIHPTPVAFRTLLAQLAAARGYPRTHFIPIPWRLIWAALRALEFLGLRLRFRSDSVVSFVNSNSNPNVDPSIQAEFRELEAVLRELRQS